jgi:hypothetical protein
MFSNSKKKEIACLKAELKRKEDLLNDTKLKLHNCEEVLKKFGDSLDNQLRFRMDMATHGYLPNENMQMMNQHQPIPTPQHQPHSGQQNHPNSDQQQQQQSQQNSNKDNGVILIQ